MTGVEARPGDLGAYDAAYVARWAPRLGAIVRRYFRAEVRGLERMPAGPCLLVGNHSGAALMPDTLVFIDAYLRGRREPPLLLLAHDGMFDTYPAPLAAFLARFGAIRARRDQALEALRRGHPVVVYPGGDRDACRSWFARDRVVFAGRRGYVRLAREADVPIVPVASIGGHDALFILHDGAWIARRLGRRARLTAFPISLSIPWGLFVGPLPGYLPLPTRIETEVLDPFEVEGDDEQVDTAVRAALQRAMDRMASARRLPVFG